MSERETIEIKTPSGKHTLTVLSYITGREMRQIENAYLSGTAVNAGTVPTISGEIADKAQDKMFEIMVVSIDGNKENILDRILDMESGDYKFVREQIRLISEGVDIKKKEE